ncbi:TonB-dependent receptor [Sphingomonas koreensis]|nr:TonB-dependent receptor [Sphingomonas koreensis]
MRAGGRGFLEGVEIMPYLRPDGRQAHVIRTMFCGVSAAALIFGAQPALAQTTTDSQTTTDAPQSPPGSDKQPAANATDLTTQASATPAAPSDAEIPQATLDQDTTDSDIVVTGIRQSLATAQSIKRNADTVVDAISAEDIGSLPDRSINEALQRVPGVSISRFASPSDSQHFSVQGSGVTIRGLDGYAKSEFNGRDTFGVANGREIGYNDVPSELAGSVEVFKNLTPDMIEGGISGTVSINTRKPFDQDKQVMFLSGAVNYNDFVDRSSPQIVGLYSNQWHLANGGRLGLLVGGSYEQLRARDDSVLISSFLPRFNAPSDGRDGYAPSDPTSANFDAGNTGANDYQGTLYDGNLCDGNNPNEGRIINAGQPYAIRTCDSFQTPAGQDTVYTPLGAGVHSQVFNIKRKSAEAALQYENADRTFLVTANYLRADYTEGWVEHTIEPNAYYNDIGNTYPADGTSFTFNDQGVFTGGTIQRINNNQAHNVTTPCTIPNNGFPYQTTYCPYTNFVNPNGINTRSASRYLYTHSLTQDASLNIKWEPTDRLHLNFDGQYVASEADSIDDNVDAYTFSLESIDLTGKIPKVDFVTPGFDSGQYFGSSGSLFYNDASNNRADDNGHEWAFQADAQYDISDGGFLRDLKVGARYADRSQTVRTNNYNNWGSLSATYTNEGPSYLSGTPDGVQADTFADFFRGKTNQPPPVLGIANSVLMDHDQLEALLRQAKDNTTPGQFTYTPLEDGFGCAQADLIDGYFCPGQIYRNSEKTWAAYARLDFSSQEFAGGMKLSGNVGVRYVHTEDDSVGAINFPQPTSVIPESFKGDLQAYCDDATKTDPNNPNPPTNSTIPYVCRPGTSQQDINNIIAFANGASVPQTAVQKYDNWLPSLNLRLDITPKLLARFAASRAISRPNFGDLQNFISLNYDGTGGTFSARASNPYLKPVQANQLDLTLEWYFNHVGSLTGTLFYKDLTDVILPNSGFSRAFDNGDSNYTLGLTGPANSDGHVKVKGFEVSYQQTFDFLPGLLSGFGAQGTYTFIDAGSVLIAPPAYQAPTVELTGNGNQPPLDITGLYDNLPLPGLSKHTVNVSAFYDKSGLYARLAYNWRSKFLLTAVDCCFPFLPVYQASDGTLDGSIFYSVGKHYKIGLQVSNILDHTVRTKYLLNGDGLEAPRSFFTTDRQYQLSVALSF